MRKQTKIAAVVSAAALLAIGASMTSFAATGWQEENGSWVYYDKNQDLVTDSWAKSGDNWYYLGSDGTMVTDSIIEDNENYYYVDVNGAMVANTWVQIDNAEADENDAPVVWYYFQNNGKAYKAPSSGNTSFKTINGKAYAFDAEGKMLYGWVSGQSELLTGDDAWRTATYYLGSYNDGARVTGSWAELDVVDTEEDEEDQKYWFYFGSNGKKYFRPDNTTGIYEKTINGKKYSFDETGKMLSEWVATPATSSNIGAYKYFSSPEDGARKTKGWFKVVPAKEVNPGANEDESNKWYYADGKGNLYASAMKTINGKKYVFNEDGEMLSGVKWLTFTGSTLTDVVSVDDDNKVQQYSGTSTTAVSVDKTGLYYLGSGDEGDIRTGIQTVSIDGESYTFKFKTAGSNKGVGVNGKQTDGYYINGLKVKADADLKYQAFVVGANDRVLRALNSEDLYDRTAGTDKIQGSKTSYVSQGLATGQKIVVLTSSGSLVSSGTKRDGNDVNLVVKNKVLFGAYINK